MKVPFYRPVIGQEDIDAVSQALQSGWIGKGQVCTHFEQAFARYIGSSHAIAVNSGTAAVTCTMTASGIGAGDLVVVPALAFTATAQAVLANGAAPLFADCDARTLSLDPAAVRRALDEYLRNWRRGQPEPAAIIPIHYGGVVGPLDDYRAIARDYGLKLIHDAAHCLNSDFRDAAGNWQRLGSIEEPLCFSLYATKCLTSGEGGMIATNDPDFADAVRRTSFHGVTPPGEAGRTGMNWDYDIGQPGWKANLNDILASLGLAQLDRARSFNARRNAIAQRYMEGLAGRIPAELPILPNDRKNSWHIFPIRIDHKALGRDRDDLLLRLRDEGVDCAVHWRPLHHFEHYRNCIARKRAFRGDLAVTDDLFPRLVSLPLSPDFSDEEIEFVISKLQKVMQSSP